MAEFLGVKCIQYMLFVINFMFAMVGTLLITMATTILVSYREFEIFIESHHFKPAEIMIAIGVIIILVSLFGGIAAIKQSVLLVNVYSLLLLFLLVLEVGGAITAFVMRASIYTNIENNMIETLFNYTTSSDAKSSWDYTQQRLHCCGVYYPKNWAPIHVHGPEVTDNGFHFKYTVPYSCCKDWPCDAIHHWGCLNVLSSYVSDIGFAVVYTTIGVEVAQVFGLIFACMFAQAIRRFKTREEMEKQQFRHMLYNQLINEQVQRSNLVHQRSNSVVVNTPSLTE